MTNTAGQDILRTEFARRVKASRTRLELNQEQVANQVRELGVITSQSLIARLESGKRTPRIEEAAALAQVLGFSLDDLPLAGRASDAIIAALAHVVRKARRDSIELLSEAADARRREGSDDPVGEILQVLRETIEPVRIVGADLPSEGLQILEPLAGLGFVTIVTRSDDDQAGETTENQGSGTSVTRSDDDQTANLHGAGHHG